MRSWPFVLVIALSLSGPVAANQPGAIGAPLGGIGPGNIASDPPVLGDPLSHMYRRGPQYTPQEWLAKLRRQCASSDAYDQRACSRGLAVLNKGHEQLRVRRAAEHAVAD